MDFKLNAPFQPTGDQPEAVRQLVEGVQRGLKHQVLLGATATGKSLGHSDPVLIAEKYGDEWIPQVCKIGELIDSIVDSDVPRFSKGGSLSLESSRGKPSGYAYLREVSPRWNEIGEELA